MKIANFVFFLALFTKSCQLDEPKAYSKLSGQCQSSSSCLDDVGTDFIDPDGIEPAGSMDSFDSSGTSGLKDSGLMLADLISSASKSSIYDSNGAIRWVELNRLLDSLSSVKINPNLKSSISDGKFYTYFDLLFISHNDILAANLRPFAPDYLGRIRKAWNYLAQNYQDNSYEINGNTIIDLRDMLAEGLKEGGVEQSRDFLLSFDDYWRTNLSRNIFSRSQPAMVVMANEFRSNDIRAWISEYHEWLDLDSLKMAIKTASPVMGHMSLSSQAEIIDYIDSLKALPSERSGKITFYPGKTMSNLGVDQVFFEDLKELDEFKQRYNRLVKEIFTIDARKFPDKLSQSKQFYKALNVHHYFHILNNGMGRVYMVLLQFESLVRQWPMHQFLQNPISTYTNSLVSIDRVIESRMIDNMKAHEKVTGDALENLGSPRGCLYE